MFPPMPILRLLADGTFHSGEALGHALHLSRTAIWKQVQSLSGAGVVVEAVRGKGYRIPGGLDLLDAARIKAGLSVESRAARVVVDLFDVVDSTNAVALSRLRVGERTGYACLAECQTAGRGRRGRAWVSPFASNIYLSIIHEFAAGFSTIDGLSLAVGVAVCEALESLGIGGVGLKWPNDIIFDGAKLGGILIEVAGDIGGACQAVIGVGVNVAMNTKTAQAIDQDWTDLMRAGLARGRRNDVATALLDGVLCCARDFERDGLAVFLSRWRRFDLLFARHVDVLSGDTVVSGVMEGVDSTGALIVRSDAGVRMFRSGEVSVRGWQ